MLTKCLSTLKAVLLVIFFFCWFFQTKPNENKPSETTILDIILVIFLQVMEELDAAALKADASSISLSHLKELQEKIYMAETCEIPADKCLPHAIALEAMIAKVMRFCCKNALQYLCTYKLFALQKVLN